MKLGLWVIITLLLATVAQARIEHYEYPSIKDDFCGVHINFQYCKCAFHNEYCDAINMNKKTANVHVFAEFEVYLKQSVETFARTCMENGGIYSAIKYWCEYCEKGKVPSEGVCTNPDDIRSIKEKYNLPDITTQGDGIDPIGYVTAAEGEFFIYSAGFQKWVGPVKKYRNLFRGDVLFTTRNGRAQIKLGNTHIYLNDRTIFRLPIREKQRSILEQGAINLWENIKRIVNNEPFEVEAAHSIAGIKGTDFIVSVDGDTATYTVNEGIVEVSLDDETVELENGDSIKVSDSIMKNDYEWDSLIKDYAGRVSSEEELNIPEIDPDKIFPTENAYSGDFGTPKEKTGSWKWLIGLVLIGGAVYWWKR